MIKKNTRFSFFVPKNFFIIIKNKIFEAITTQRN